MSIERLTRAAVPGRLRPLVAGAVRARRHRGDAVHCPCCESDFASFRPHRARRDAKCPRCGSLERHRLLWLYLTERADILSRELRMLHFAPEYFLQRRLRKLPNLTYRSADIDSPLAMDAVDITAMQYGDESFDLVLCNHVLEHVDDDGRAMAEIARVLAPGGTAIVMCPIDYSRATTFEDPAIVTPEDRFAAYGQEDHARLYGRDFADRLRAAGFDVEVVSALDDFPADVVERCRLRRDDEQFGIEEIFVCTARAAVPA